MNEGTYKFPRYWRWVRLGEVCTLIESGFAFRKKGAPEGDLLHLRPYNIAEDGTLDLSQRFYVPSSLRSARHKFLQPGDVLFNNTNSVELVGKTALVREPLEAAFSNHITLLRPDTTKAEGAWIALVLLALWRQGFFANLCNKWIGQAGINTETLRSVLIPLPPLEEQRRIVARVEELMSRIREAKRLRQEAKEEAERLWQSILSETFPKPGTELPEGWQWVKLGEVAKIYAGSPAPQGEQYFREGKWPFVRVQDLGRYGQTTCLKETADCVNEYALQKYRLRLAKAGTILFPKSGAAILTNSRAILGVDAYIVSHLAAIEPLPDRLDTYWAYFWLCTVDMKEFIDNPSYPSLRLSEISKLIIPLPPLEDQRRIVAYFQDVQGKIRALKEVQAQTEAELKRLEQAILDKAFRGEL
jgi:type I restriction enzyme S subunit